MEILTIAYFGPSSHQISPLQDFGLFNNESCESFGEWMVHTLVELM